MTTRKPMSPQELEAALRHVGATRYHNLHPFHKRLHSGQCSFEEVQAWALNRYFYQATIPIKDATVLSRMNSSADRREWRKRIEDHDGTREGEGGIERWLKLTESLGFNRDYVISTRGILAPTRFAVEAYVNFCAQKTLLEAVASSLTELFSPNIINERVSGMLNVLDREPLVERHNSARRWPISPRVRRRRSATAILRWPTSNSTRRLAPSRMRSSVRSNSRPTCSGCSSMRSGALMSPAQFRRAHGGPAKACKRARAPHERRRDQRDERAAPTARRALKA